MRFLELKIPPPLVAAIVAGLMFAVARATPQWTAPIPGRLIVMIALIVAGAATALAGVIAFRRHKTTVNPMKPQASTTVVTSGVYRWSRNPMYLGLLIALAGIAIYLSNPVAVLLLAAFVLYINRFQIRPEERVLHSRFGDEYARYAARVRRWI